jgi:mannosylglycoprotein endo-beta-mannosidase
MNKHSAPGPDGFGPGFYSAAWGTIRNEVLKFLNSFHQGEVDLDRINRSYMVLLPKKPGAVTVDAFRPICLQNCSVKILAKILTSRLQQEISALIDLNQTGFLQGRSISETFVYAVELVQVCHKRKLPTLMLKLDFAKAFDTVNWECLFVILKARGFEEVWIDWIRTILSSSKSAVLVNGCPGPWINCKRGLRQGDPLSPYLFLLVAETLQRMIQREFSAIPHPIESGTPCAVLQYAADTLILLKGIPYAVSQLKIILDQFAAATGLSINYNKSTAVPIHMDESVTNQCIEILGCRKEGFPQTYLGCLSLPLNCRCHLLPLTSAKLIGT